MTEKLTKRDYFLRLRDRVSDDSELVEFINHELDLLKRKNERKPSKPTAKQVENANLMDVIYDAMQTNVPYRVKDIQTLVPALADAHINKVTHLVSKMRDNVLVSREVVKGVAYFTKI